MSDFEVHPTGNDELARLRSELEAQTQVTAQQTHEMLRARLSESALRQQNERLREALQRIDTMIDRDGNFIDMHREELRGIARAALAADQSEEGK